VREATAEVETTTGSVVQVFTTGTMVQVFLLGPDRPADAVSVVESGERGQQAADVRSGSARLGD
jgi:hypothetical protein